MKTKVKAKDCNLVVRVKTSFGETSDEEKLSQFCRTGSRGFLKPNVLKKNLVEYHGPIGISLYERLMEPMSKRDFLFILEQAVVALQKIDENHLDLNALVLNLQYVFINRMTREVWFLYVPTTMESKETDVRGFLESIVYSVKPAEKCDEEAIAQFMYFLRGQKQIEFEKIERYISKEDGNIVRLIRKQLGGQSGFITNKMRHYVEHYEKKQDDDEPTELLEECSGDLEEEATGLLDDESPHDGTEAFDTKMGEEEATGLLLEEHEDWTDEEATGLLQDNTYDEEATGVLSDDDTMLLQEECEATALLNSNTARVQFPILYRVSTAEKISINKPVFRLGKEKSYVDYFVTNNVAVSRSHADIITRGTKCFIIDLNSKNHTYINDEPIPVHCEVEIHNEDNLRLGNEEFVFYQ